MLSPIMYVKLYKYLMKIHSPDIPEISTNRLDTIRNRLDDDNYIVDIQQITSKFIDLEIALTGLGKKQVA